MDVQQYLSELDVRERQAEKIINDYKEVGFPGLGGALDCMNLI